MKKSKFTDAQIAFVLRQAEEGTAIGEVSLGEQAVLNQAAHERIAGGNG